MVEVLLPTSEIPSSNPDIGKIYGLSTTLKRRKSRKKRPGVAPLEKISDYSLPTYLPTYLPIYLPKVINKQTNRSRLCERFLHEKRKVIKIVSDVVVVVVSKENIS